MQINNLVMVFGTFDVLHPGHLWFLKKASQYGRLIVALTPDKMCLKYKDHLPCHSFIQRKSHLEDIIYLDKVIGKQCNNCAHLLSFWVMTKNY